MALVYSMLQLIFPWWSKHQAVTNWILFNSGSWSFCPSLQSGVLPATHWGPCLHRGGLRGQRSTDRFLRPHRKELRHSEWNEKTHIHTVESKPYWVKQSCVPVREEINGGIVSSRLRSDGHMVVMFKWAEQKTAGSLLMILARSWFSRFL